MSFSLPCACESENREFIFGEISTHVLGTLLIGCMGFFVVVVECVSSSYILAINLSLDLQCPVIYLQFLGSLLSQ